MGILVWIVFGLVVGLIARALMPGRQNLGLIATTLLGVAGSLIGGLVGSLISGAEAFRFTPAGFIGSILGAILLLFLIGLANRPQRYA